MPHAPRSDSSISSNASSVTLDAFTFDGKPFTVTIPSMTTVACGATAKIFVGHVVHRDRTLPVAVKVFGNMLEDHHQELLRRELRTARQVSVGKHPSILPFIGSASFGMQTAIVSHYMRNGNLLEYFRTQQRENIDKAKLIIQVAEAVNHLHTVERLVHGDLKCANVLVSELGDALLADFGLSTFVEKAQTNATTAMNVRQMYTVRFAAPEILQDMAGQPERVRSKTRESDVYAFGMLVLEAITECPPWAEYHNFAVINNVSKGLRPARPQSGFSQVWWDICRGCWRIEPDKRPTMRIVLKRLRRDPQNKGEMISDSPPSWITWAPHRRWPPQEPEAAPQTHIAEAPARTLQKEIPSPESPAKAIPLARRADTSAPRLPLEAPHRMLMRSQVIPAAATAAAPPPQTMPTRQSSGESSEWPHTNGSAAPAVDPAARTGSGSTNTWPPSSLPAGAGEPSWLTSERASDLKGQRAGMLKRASPPGVEAATTSNQSRSAPRVPFGQGFSSNVRWRPNCASAEPKQRAIAAVKPCRAGPGTRIVRAARDAYQALVKKTCWDACQSQSVQFPMSGNAVNLGFCGAGCALVQMY